MRIAPSPQMGSWRPLERPGSWPAFRQPARFPLEVDDMLKRLAMPVGLFCALLMLPGTAGAHAPGTYGGDAKPLCGPALGGSLSVAATRVSCRTAWRVATRRVRDGKTFKRWRCRGTQAGSAFGHCHGKGPKRGAIVHWGVND